MIRFQVRPGARLSCRTDFTVHAAANLHFYDADFAAIPFHVSLRPAEGKVVVNRRDAAGWRRELAFPHAFRLPAGSLEVRFGPGSVRVAVDGVEIGRFDRFPRPDRAGRFFLRRGFPGLARIAGVVPEGGILPGDLLVQQGSQAAAAAPAARLAGDAGFVLTDRMEVLAPQDAQALRLPWGEDLALRAAQGGGTGAVLPGRVWREVAEGAALRLETIPGGQALDFDRAGLAAWLERVAAGEQLVHDDFLALQALEHAHFAGVLDRLPAPAQAGLQRAAARFGLGDFLAGVAGAQGGVLPAPPGAAVQPPRPAEDLAFATLARRWREDPAADPQALLAEVLAAVPAPDDWLFLRLVEAFCLNDAFPVLAAAAGDRFAAREWGSDRWTASTLLPFLAAAGRVAELPALLWWLAEPRPGLLITPAVAAGVRAALDRPGLPDQLAADIVYGWMGLIDRESQDYHGRQPCAAVLDLSARLVAGAGRLPGYLRRDLHGFALRAHGLQPGFWAALEAHGLPDDPLLAEARAAFAVLAAGDAAPAAAAALEPFAWQRNPEVARFRRILLGPAGVPLDPGEAPGLAALRAAGTDPGEALLRHLMFPDDRLGVPQDPALLRLAAAAVAPAWEGVVIPPQAALQADLGRRLPAILRAPPQGAALDALAADLAALSGPHSHWLGDALTLVLIAAFAGGDAGVPAAARLCAALAARQPHIDRPARDGAAAVVAALGPIDRRLALPQAPEMLRWARSLFAPPLVPLPPVAPPAGVSMLHDLVVVVYSCRANLETRIPALRAGWLADLAAHGIPYVVAVGGATPAEAGRQQGDVVFLDCPDDYEGLPQKTLAMIRWVHDRTGFARLLKIDDDCFVDCEQMFGNLQHLKFDYAGRVLTPARGQMDRTWHNAKARSPRGRFELDKSPEPSVYADGGSGYVLTRRAMAAALGMADSPEGQRLAEISFMEDKLLGDLLARAGIWAQGEGWRFAQERRTGVSGLTVPFWANGPRPFRGAGVAGVHLDGHVNQPAALAAARSDRPQRGRIWPSWQGPRFGWSSNTVTLVGPPDRLRRAAGAEVAVVACLRNEMFMLPHFLAHYRALGVEGFLLVDNGSDDGTPEYLAGQPDVALFSADTPYGRSHYGVAWQEALLSAFRPGRWTLVADADELLVWDDSAAGDLPALLREPEFAGADAVRLFMLDMYPQGPLSGADFAQGTPFDGAGCADLEPFLTTAASRGPFSDQPTWTSALRHRLIPGSRPELFVAQKLALLRLRPWMRLTEGLHYLGGARPAARELLLAHFKYTAAFRAKAEAEVARRQHFNDAEEYRRYLALVAEGRETIFDPAFSAAWNAGPFVRGLLAAGRPPLSPARAGRAGRPGRPRPG